ncbi:MAG: PIN domain-containing protein [Nanoarchaeota archaeon]|nr:PIN domain-containing protein [Nanoarchaeota archaeon]
MKYFVDSCIWRDFYEGRFSKSGRDLGSAASKFFAKVIKEKHKMLYSEDVISELKKDYSAEEVEKMLSIFYLLGLLEKVETKSEEHREAMKLRAERELPYVDCLVAIQARNHKAIAVSQDYHFTEGLSDIVEILKPKD